MKLKFITLNIWNKGVMLDRAIDFIKNEKPDVLALQEVCDGHDSNLHEGLRSLSILRNNLDFPYCAFSPAFFEIHGSRVNEGNVVFSKFPIVEESATFFDVPYGERSVDDKDFSRTPRNMQHVVIRIGDKILNVFNTQGIWGIDGEDNDRRLDMCRIVADKTKNEKNVILSGDFNVRSDTKSIGQIEKHLTNIFRNRLKTTFNMKIKSGGGFGSSVVDMIFVSKEIKIISSRCHEINVSDHLPLEMMLEF